MKPLAAKAAKAWDEEQAPAASTEEKADYGSDLETEMEAFAAAFEKKDTAGMAAAFKEAHRLCSKT